MVAISTNFKCEFRWLDMTFFEVYAGTELLGWVLSIPMAQEYFTGAAMAQEYFPHLEPERFYVPFLGTL